MPHTVSRREVLSALSASAGLFGAREARADDSLPTSPVAVAACKTYGQELLPKLATMFDQLGGLGGLVRDRTVAIKINLVGNPWAVLGDNPIELTTWTHPAVIGAAIRLLDGAGARRIRVIECCGDTLDPFDGYIAQAGWDPNALRNAAPRVEFENTNGIGNGTSYSRLYCADGGYIFPSYDVNHSYVDCDVFVSIAKMKEHSWFGATLSMKNCYGMTPLTIYGERAGIDEPSTDSVGGPRVSVLHEGTRAPSHSAPQENDPNSPRAGDYRIPRIVPDIVSARPVHLAIIDGIETMAGGEGPWATNARRVSPGVLLAGFNPVTTDAVALAVMGFDPSADRGAPPFEGCDSFLRFAEERRLGTRDLSRIEVRGARINEVRFDFRTAGTTRPGPSRRRHA